MDRSIDFDSIGSCSLDADSTDFSGNFAFSQAHEISICRIKTFVPLERV